jgi:uncharacterized membrane protein
MEDISRAFEWIACVTLIAALSLAVVAVTRDVVRGEAGLMTYRRGREIFARGLLISLEVLVAADLIRTIAVQPTLTNVGVLGLIVLVRTLLSFSLNIEIDGVLPWRKRALDATDAERKQATASEA